MKSHPGLTSGSKSLTYPALREQRIVMKPQGKMEEPRDEVPPRANFRQQVSEATHVAGRTRCYEAPRENGGAWGMNVRRGAPGTGTRKPALTCFKGSEPDATAGVLRACQGPTGPRRAPVQAMKGSSAAPSHARPGRTYWYAAQQSGRQSAIPGRL
ncbi:hypothetical protein NDU88_001771 [Pleurodeles waltl]|uniref:Uncharacterized protein n=1 Tax=Pleurodeles waltl TaxID=8319 RepID=A0AAV7LDU1_PLEWA|nr:hypothetical protein NDU88_001771 [Pleurodeles waltl]